MKAGQEHLKEEMKVDHVELMERMKAGQEKIEGMMETCLEKWKSRIWRQIRKK
jgi:hypothetical protein